MRVTLSLNDRHRRGQGRKARFSGDFPEQVKKMLQLANTEVDSNTSYLFFPETALTEPIWENNLKDNASIPLLINYTKKHPGLTKNVILEPARILVSQGLPPCQIPDFS